MTSFTFPSERQLTSLFERYKADVSQHGWRVRMRQKFGHHKPELWYQTVVDSLVTEECRWLDVGGGKDILSRNPELSRELAERCKYLIAVDPSETVNQNKYVDDRAQTTIEKYQSDELFDLATLRMVAEHVLHPALAVESLRRLVKPKGYVVVFTPNKWSIMSLMASAIPDRFHPLLVRILSPRRKEEDVFPTHYKMNTKRQLNELFATGGFEEVGFKYLDDVAGTQRFRIPCFIGLCVWKIFHVLQVVYPENNLLGVYRRCDEK